MAVAQMEGNVKSIYAISFAPIPRSDSREHLELLHVARWPFCSFIFRFGCLRAQPNKLPTFQLPKLAQNTGNTLREK